MTWKAPVNTDKHGRRTAKQPLTERERESSIADTCHPKDALFKGQLPCSISLRESY